MRSIKNVVVLTKDGAFALLSPPWGIWQLKSPHPREFAIQGGAGGGVLGAGGIDWCISVVALLNLASNSPPLIVSRH